MKAQSITIGGMSSSATTLTLADILAARERIGDAVYLSPCTRSEMLSRMTGQSVFLKLENLQMTGSFKERGALSKISTLTPEQAKWGVVAASAGNHAQGVAYHATQRGIRAVIVMPLTTPLVKVTATRGFGAEVVLHGANYDEACVEATRLCEAEGMTFIHPFDDPLVMAGQGTIGLELLEQIEGLEAVVVPIGGGGLIGGIACAVKESKPGVRVIVVQTSRLPSMRDAVAAHHPVTLEPATTIADGIAVRRAGEVTFPVVEKYVDEIVTVDEDEIASAILTLLEREKTLAEGAGAAAVTLRSSTGATPAPFWPPRRLRRLPLLLRPRRLSTPPSLSESPCSARDAPGSTAAWIGSCRCSLNLCLPPWSRGSTCKL